MRFQHKMVSFIKHLYIMLSSKFGWLCPDYEKYNNTDIYLHRHSKNRYITSKCREKYKSGI